jgi:hypothetical protein
MALNMRTLFGVLRGLAWNDRLPWNSGGVSGGSQ